MNWRRIFLLGLVAIGVSPTVKAQAPLAPSVLEKMPSTNVAAKLTTNFEGTLFFTPLQRREMDRERKQVRSGYSGQPAQEVRSIINGLATRSDGKLTVWVDGTPIWENSNARHFAELSGADVGAPVGDIDRTGSEDGVKSSQPVKIKKAFKKSEKQARK